MTATQFALFCGLADAPDRKSEKPFYFDHLIRLVRQNEPDRKTAGYLAIAYAAFASRVRDVTGKSGATSADARQSAFALRHDPLMRSVAQVLDCEVVVHQLVSQFGF